MSHARLIQLIHVGASLESLPMPARRNELWPAYPLRPGTTEWGEGAATQTVREVEVSMMHRGINFGLDKTRTVVQLWERGMPWWTTMRVHGEYGNRGTGGRLEIEGVVVSWKLSEKRRAHAGERAAKGEQR